MASSTASKACRFPWMSETIATRIWPAARWVRGYSLAGEAPVAPPTGRILAPGRRRGGGWRAVAGPARGAYRAGPDRSTHVLHRRRDPARCRGSRGPSWCSGSPRAAIELGALASVVRRPPRWLSRPGKRPVVAGAAAGAGLAVGLSVPTLPLRAVSRRRGMAVGLVTQSWRGWAADLVKSAGIEAVLAGGAGAAAVAVTRRYPRTWWLPASAGSVLFGSASGGTRAGRARPGVQRLHAPARGRDAL